MRLLDELGSLADGDLTVQATVTEDITGAIADSVNYTVEELRTLVSAVQSTVWIVSSTAHRVSIVCRPLHPGTVCRPTKAI